jgi:MFS family permease
MQNVGILAALYIAQALTANMEALFMAPAAIGVVGTLIYAFVLSDKRLRRRPPEISFRAFLQTFWVSPRKHPDFAWAWISRFLLILGSFMFTTFRLFWMVDEIGLDPAEAAGVVFTGVLIYTAVLVVVLGQAAGVISDRVGRRKIFVFFSTALFAVGLAMPTQVDSVAGFYLVEAIMGAAFGIYLGVDLALVLAVLPHPADNAKDLGVFNIANAAPRSLAPFLGAALLPFIGALAIFPVRKVK